MEEHVEDEVTDIRSDGAFLLNPAEHPTVDMDIVLSSLAARGIPVSLLIPRNDAVRRALLTDHNINVDKLKWRSINIFYPPSVLEQAEKKANGTTVKSVWE